MPVRGTDQRRAVTDSTGRDDVTTPEEGRVLRVPPRTVERWANEGRIPCLVTCDRRAGGRDVEPPAPEQPPRAARRPTGLA